MASKDAQPIPFQIQIVDAVGPDNPPRVKVGKWIADGPFMSSKPNENFHHFKDQVLSRNGFEAHILRGDPEVKSKEEAAAFRRDQNKYYAKMLGGMFNSRLYKFQRAAFFNPFHPRVTRLFGQGMRQSGPESFINRQGYMSDRKYREIWKIKHVLNDLAKNKPHILPICFQMSRTPEEVIKIVGPQLYDVLNFNSARRNEDIMKLVAMADITGLAPRNNFPPVKELIPLLHFLVCMPSEALRNSTQRSLYLYTSQIRHRDERQFVDLIRSERVPF